MTDPAPEVAPTRLSLGKLFCLWCQGEPLRDVVDGIAEWIAADPDFSLDPLPAQMQQAVWAGLLAHYDRFALDDEIISIWGGTSTDPEATAAWLERRNHRFKTYLLPSVKTWIAARAVVDELDLV